MSYSEAMPPKVECSYEGCNFEARSIEEMINHQTSLRHPGWGNIPPDASKKAWICGQCKKGYVTWAILYVHLTTHSLPFSCNQCGYKVGRQNRLKRHML